MIILRFQRRKAMKINVRLDGKIISVKSVGRVETPWGVLYNYYEDLRGNYYGDENDTNDKSTATDNILFIATAKVCRCSMRYYPNKLGFCPRLSLNIVICKARRHRECPTQTFSGKVNKEVPCTRNCTITVQNFRKIAP